MAVLFVPPFPRLMTSWLSIALPILAATAGMAVAWIAAQWYWRPAAPRPADETDQFAHDTLSKLQDLTRLVKAGVDQHASCVDEINAQLSHSPPSDDGSVLAAVADLIQANERMKQQL